VVRASTRDPAALDWELDLLSYLAGVLPDRVLLPQPVPADDGRRHVAGVVVTPFLPGEAPRDTAGWRRAVAAIGHVHDATPGWPQRPGFASAAELYELYERGGDVDLSLLPADAVTRVRSAWAPVLDGPSCAVHGDFGGGNVLVAPDTVAILDWDESRADVPAFDLAHVPDESAPVLGVDRGAVVDAGVAWEVATCWQAEPGYAARRLDELRHRQAPSGR